MSIEKKDRTEDNCDDVSEIDLYSFHEQHAGRLIIDPACVCPPLLFLRVKLIIFTLFSEAKIELGAAVAARLKLSEDGTKVLWPQPTDSPLDPQNWSMRRRNLQLFIITLAAVVPDFDSGIGKRRDSVLRIKPTRVLRIIRYCIHLCVGDAVQYDTWNHQQFDLKACDESLYAYAMTIYLQSFSWSIFLLGQSVLPALFSPKTIHEQCST